MVAARIPNICTQSHFRGVELWGSDAESGVVVHLDLFEPYLDAVPDAHQGVRDD